MDFYKLLSEFYDELFPVNPGEMDFLISRVAGAGRVLDVGCGTGNKTVLFKDAAEMVFGADIDRNMLEKAREKHSAANVFYLECGLGDLGNEFEACSLDVVLCLGNVLPHLNSLARIQEALLEIYGIIRGGGRIIVQILNYDRIIKGGIEDLPVLESGDVKFMRRNEWRGEQMFFLTTLKLKNSDEEYSGGNPFYALTRKELEQSLALAGFEEVEFFGNFSGGAWNENSFLSLVIARKPRAV